MPTVQARITRAKRRIAVNRIPIRVPEDPLELRRRLPLVLNAISLIFTEDYDATTGASHLRTELTGEAIRLARIVQSLLPQQAEPADLLALLLLTDAHRAARQDDDGVPVPLEDQDRGRWDTGRITEGIWLAERAVAWRRAQELMDNGAQRRFIERRLGRPGEGRREVSSEGWVR